MTGSIWIFGYGSLVWRPAFPYAECRHAYIVDWARRFWQGSTDHRGVVGAPGRVVTLIPEPGACTWGIAYRLESEDASAVLARLDHRERGGYRRHVIRLTFAGGQQSQGLVYRATSSNENYLGPAPLAEIAAQIQRSSGPSGHNSEYILRLEEMLQRMGARDEHVSALAALVRGLERDTGPPAQGDPARVT